MEESLARELMRMQHTLASVIPDGLWQRWAEVNEEVVWVLENLCGDSSWQTAEDQLCPGKISQN